MIFAAARIQILFLFALFWCRAQTSLAAETAAQTPAEPVQAFSLPDQFQRDHWVAFTNAPVRLLTVADQRGAEKMDPWIAAVKQRFGTNLAMIAVADVSKVPRLLRGFIRGKFVERYPHPVLLDFKGDTIAPWRPKAGEPNLYLLAPDGRILGHWHGSATDPRVSALLHAIVESGVHRSPPEKRERATERQGLGIGQTRRTRQLPPQNNAFSPSLKDSCYLPRHGLRPFLMSRPGCLRTGRRIDTFRSRAQGFATSQPAATSPL